jgi:hypothetical protein
LLFIGSLRRALIELCRAYRARVVPWERAVDGIAC